MVSELENRFKLLKKENRCLQKSVEALKVRQREQEQENSRQKALLKRVLREFKGKNLEMGLLTEKLELSFAQIRSTNDRLKKEINEHRRAEQELKVSESKYRTIFETAGTAIAIIDGDFVISMANSEFRRIFAENEQDINQSNFRDFFQKDQLDKFEDPEARALRRQKIPVTRELQVINRAGQARDVIITLSGIPESTMSVVSIIDITERKRVEELVRNMAYHDALTGLPNRKMFQERFNHDLSVAKRTGIRMGVLFLDLDGFKKINDTFGHDAGDQVLKEVAKRLKTILRDGDTVARMGGDEFTILLSKIDQVDESAFVSKRILEAFKTPVCFEGTKISVKTSIGISIYPMHGETPELLLRNADDAMYSAKRAGKNSFRIFCEADDSPSAKAGGSK